MGWRRWFRYGKARVTAAAHDLDEALERKEAELDAERTGKPWLVDDDDVPSFEDTKARIEEAAGTDSPASPFDLDAQQKAADERLAKIRESLGIEDDDHPKPTTPPPKAR